MRQFCILMIVIFAALLGPPAEASSFSERAFDNDSIIDQGAIVNSALLVNDGNHGGNGRKVDLGPPAANKFDNYFLVNNIGPLDKFGVGVNTTAIVTSWPDMCNRDYKLINIAAYVAPKAGPRHHSD